MSKKLSIAAAVSILLPLALLAGGIYYYLTNPLLVAQVFTPPSKEPTAAVNIKLLDFPKSTRITGRSVCISTNGTLGAGAVLDSKTIITVRHVVAKQNRVLVDVGRYERKWVPAAVIGHVRAKPEPVVILKLLSNDSFLPGEAFNRGTGIALPTYMVTPNGVFPWNPGTVVPGDSGSAVLNSDGELIGLVTGFILNDKAPVVTLIR